MSRLIPRPLVRRPQAPRGRRRWAAPTQTAAGGSGGSDSDPAATVIEKIAIPNSIMPMAGRHPRWPPHSRCQIPDWCPGACGVLTISRTWLSPTVFLPSSPVRRGPVNANDRVNPCGNDRPGTDPNFDRIRASRDQTGSERPACRSRRTASNCPAAQLPDDPHLPPSVSAPAFHAVVRGFLGDDDVVGMAFPDGRRRHLDELRIPPQFIDRPRAAVAHAGPETAHELIQEHAERTLERHPSLDALRHQLVTTAARRPLPVAFA